MRAVVLDSGAVTRLASRDRLSAARIGSLKRRGIWPPVVPSVVLAECLTGRQSIDAVTNRFLKGCDIEEQLPEQIARNAGRLRDRTGRASEISAVDAVVIAMAEPVRPCSQRDKDQWWYWTDEWQAGEQQITADRAAGRRGPVFASGDEFLAALREGAATDGAGDSTSR